NRELERIHSVFDVGGDEDDLHLRQGGAQLPGQFHAAVAGHFDVQQDQVEEKTVLRDVVQQVVAVGIQGYAPRSPAAFQAGFGGCPVGLGGGLVIIADGYAQHG